MGFNQLLTPEIKLAKGKSANYDLKKPKRLVIYTAASWPAWQDKCIELVGQQWGATGAVDVKALTRIIDKQDIKKAMPFVQILKRRLEAGEPADAVLGAGGRLLPFDEPATLREIVPSLRQTIPKLKVVDIVTSGGETAPDDLAPAAKAATPGSPTFHFENIDA